MQKHSPFFLDSMTGAKNPRGIGDFHILESFVYLFSSIFMFLYIGGKYKLMRYLFTKTILLAAAKKTT